MSETEESWMLDAAIVGAAFVAPPILAVGAGAPTIGVASVAWMLVACAVLTAAVGGGGGALVGGVLHRAARAVPVVVVWLLELLLGAACGAATLGLTVVVVTGDTTFPGWFAVVWSTLFGALAIGPPSMLYTAVRRRGRRGLCVVALAVGWIWVAWLVMMAPMLLVA
jgi:hypothetical protein